MLCEFPSFKMQRILYSKEYQEAHNLRDWKADFKLLEGFNTE